MSHCKRFCTALCSLAATVWLAAGSAQAGLTGLWEFDNAGNLGLATVGTDLTFQGASPTHSASLADDHSTSLTGVITTAAANAANRILASHGASPNGGGLYVNQYTIVTDIFSPTASRDQWRTIYQTNTANSNDGDYFIRNNNDLLGSSEMNYTTNPIDETKWTRLVLTVDLSSAGNDAKTYLDGNLHFTHPPNLGLDGRFSLDPTMFFFTDEDGDNAPLNVGVVGIYDFALSAQQVALLGRAGAPVLAIPEPGTFALALLASVGLVGLRLRKGKK